MRAALLALTLTLVACGKSTIDDFGGPPAGAPASPAQMKALDGLRPGDALAGTKVVRVDAVDRGMMPVIVEAQGARARLDVCLFSDEAPGPVARTERYAIYLTSGDKGAPQLPADVTTAAIEALAARLKKVESSAPPPAGVTTYASEKAP